MRGGGRHGAREAAWEADRNIRVEVICDDPTSNAIAEHVRQKYSLNYATTLFVTDVGVLRPEKF